MTFELRESHGGDTCYHLSGCNEPTVRIAFDAASSLCRKHYLESELRMIQRNVELGAEHEAFYLKES
jgi:hypothetical protein